MSADLLPALYTPSGPPVVGGTSAGNRLTLITDGNEAFRLAYEAIRQARTRVWLESYIVEPDEVGRPAIAALAEAARRGCDVVLLFDRWGSPRLGRRHAAPILEAGGRVATFNPVLPWQKLGRKVASILHRDHRKILIADDVGFCGGRNISVDYGGAGPARFFDETVRLEGPCVRDLAHVFADSFYDATGASLALPPPPPPFPDGVPVAVLGLNARQQELDLKRAIHRLLQHTRRSCYVMTPYFIPPRWFMNALCELARRGTDVRVLTAGHSDVPAARTAGRHLYGRLLRAGVRIFEHRHPILHAKHLTLDDTVGIAGSYNVDRYGEKHNLEVGVIALDPAFTAQLNRTFFERLHHAEEITRSAWQRRTLAARAAQWSLFQLSRI
ncbi:hypothetical protein AWN76_012270 [Rhodothermaceae bacterium RA]|nr:hypothetical protein AWN76_012270 [Rhodothermaceae bacterium RA]